VLACSISSLSLPEVAAGTITTVNVALPGASTGSLGPVGGTPVAPNNDNALTASPNAIAGNWFLNANGFGPMDFEFVVANSGGTTEYAMAQRMVNNSGVTWTGFRLELGFGTGAGFVRASPGTGLDFDTPDADPAPTSTVFTLLDAQPTMLDWSGGAVWPIGQGVPLAVAFAFAVDVPDGLQTLNPSGLNRFTLRQVPTRAATPIPEPGLLGLFGVGAAWAARRRARPCAHR
jgi:hypothetical protein